MAKNPPSPIIVPETPNVSLVSVYGKKAPDFEALLLLLQGYLSNQFSNQFKRIPLDQIHGTIIGCEGLKTPQGILSKWFLEKRNEFRYLKLEDFIPFVHRFEQLSVQIRIAGYQPHLDYGFRSQNQHPYRRSFQFRNHSAVLMGWPYYRSQFPPDLGQFRQDAQQFNVLHKYQPIDALDNDCYFKIGEIDPTIPEKKRVAVESKLQDMLKTQSPVLLSLNQKSLQFTQYQDLSLPRITTQVVSLETITSEQLKNWYPTLSNPRV